MGYLLFGKYDLSKSRRMTVSEALALNEKEGLIPMEVPEDVLNDEKKMVLDYVGTDENNLIRFKVSYEKR